MVDGEAKPDAWRGLVDAGGRRGTRLARAAAWLAPYAARLGHGYFADGVDRAVCRAIHGAARRRTLFRFAPAPPVRELGRARGAHAADEYGFRSPFVSPLRERNEAVVRCYRGGVERRALVVFNPDDGLVARVLVTRAFVARLSAAGLDVAVPIAPGTMLRRAPADRRRGWAHSVGAALAAIVQLVHDNVAVETWARAAGYRTVVAAGIGHGGTVAALLAATTTCFDAYVPMLAGAHPGWAWLPPRASAAAVHARALARDGVRRRATLARLFDPVAPLRLGPPRARERCTIVGARFDRVVLPADVGELGRHWSVAPLWTCRRAEVPRQVVELATIVARLVTAASR